MKMGNKVNEITMHEEREREKKDTKRLWRENKVKNKHQVGEGRNKYDMTIGRVRLGEKKERVIKSEEEKKN